MDPPIAPPTCLFTGVDLVPQPREEHAILRCLGGRIRSRRISSNEFNNATSNGFDDLLAGPYATAFNYLAPLLSAEHAQAAVDLVVGGSRQYRLHPGGQVGVHGTRIGRRDEQGRPVEIAHEDPQAVLRFAANAGWPADSWSQTHEIAATEAEAQRRAPVLHPSMEVAALKCALLAFDEVLADAPENRFTRDGWLAHTREAIRDIVLHGDDPRRFLDRVSWGLSPRERERVLALRRQLVPDDETPFEHVLVASGDPDLGTIDVAWLLAETDVWAFRLTRLWNGPPFTAIAGCGVLRETHRWAPVVLGECRWQLGQRSVARSVRRGVTEEQMGRTAARIAEARHEAFRRAVDLVERRCDDVVAGGILNLARFPEAEPVIAPDNRSIARGLERRLRRLFFQQCESEDGREYLDAALAAELDALPAAVRGQTVMPDDDVGAAVSWPDWVRCHRRVLDAVAGRFGLPGHVYSISVSVEPTD